jgi:hypothetical protein
MEEAMPRVDNNTLFPLVSKLITAGFRGSSQIVVDEHIREYVSAQKKELAATVPHEDVRSKQLQAVIADLTYVETVIKEHGIAAYSKCHEMVARSVARLTAMQ